MALSFLSAVSALRAAGEPSRLRLLALLTRAELTVGELCEILGQSQPRVSRHLKILASAGLLDRFREEQWVYYRVPTSGEATKVVEQLLSLLADDDEVLERDRRRMDNVIAARALQTTTRSIEALSPECLADIAPLVLRELPQESVGALLDVGTGSGHLLELLAPRAARAVGIDISTDALRLARTNVHGAGLHHCELHKGDMYDLPFPTGTFDTVTADRALANAQRPLLALGEIARVLRAGGRLVLIEDFDALADSVGGNPINTLRDWLLRSGLECTRIHPVDTRLAHLLIAVGQRLERATAVA